MARGVSSTLSPPLTRRGHADVAVTTAAGIVLLLLAAFVVWPVARVLATSFAGPSGPTFAHYAEFLGSWRLVRILLNSLLVSAISTTLTVAIGLVLAYAVTRTD